MVQSLLPNILEFISQIDPFDKLPAELQKQIAGSVRISYLARGEQITFNPEDPKRYLYIIRTGVMEQRKPNGVLRAKLGPQDLFGFTFLEAKADGEDDYIAIAAESTLLYLVPHEDLQKLLAEHPEYSEYFASQAQIRLQSALNVVWSDNEKGLFVKKVSEVTTSSPAIVTSDMTIQQVAQEMRYVLRTSTAVVKQKGRIVGIITDRDMTKRVVADGVSPDRPISEVMTKHPITVGPNDLVLTAASLMMQNNIRSLPVVSGHKVHGLLTTSHLVQKNRVQAIFLIDTIKRTNTVEGLAGLTQERQAIFEALVEGKVRSEIVGQVMAMIYDAFNKRLIQLAEETFGPAPCKFAWIVAGSHARNEIHITSDQDSALIVDDSATVEDMAYFKLMATFVCESLAKCGFILCPGHFMASNPKWAQKLHVWKDYYRKWITTPDHETLLNTSVFLETRCIYGDKIFADKLQEHLYKLISQNRNFLTTLVNDATSVHPPLGIFNSLVLEKGGQNSNTLNIKKYAITLIVDLARIYGLSVGCTSTNTEERFRYAYKKKVLSEDAMKNILGAYRFICQLRFRHQLEALKKGEEPNNHIAPDSFGSFERTHLKDAFRIIGNLQDAAKLRFGEA
ncbi:putative nucleotidyltransferase substrate binding domain-containing protein [Reinekea thalattae]|uniref:Cyclic nucleotide-binding/CBS domain-containing protein n=1 Tax=Reinekea thalattae TaxID=2593301 RepID=A0A5C8Z3B1_9GAMM|nr:putative nucleotidyltransferase substrate binding domain-containing protein [Reinekea thalattae]TXR51386.1 cyclic nucleotide-binding/CBS domain-containing protein [Reinekea thalattae]